MLRYIVENAILNGYIIWYMVKIIAIFKHPQKIIKIFYNSSKIYYRSKYSLYDNNLYSTKDEYIFILMNSKSVILWYPKDEYVYFLQSILQ